MVHILTLDGFFGSKFHILTPRWLPTTATIAGARIAIQVDIGFGDAITPAAIEIDYPALLDAPAPHLRAYPVETVVAEKFEALVTLGVANSRLKDFYDLWVISRTFELRRVTLREAVRRTFERRGTALPSDTPVGLTDEYAEAWAAQWRAFLGRDRMAAAPDALAVTVADLRAFLMPLVVGLNEERIGGRAGRGRWRAQSMRHSGTTNYSVASCAIDEEQGGDRGVEGKNG